MQEGSLSQSDHKERESHGGGLAREQQESCTKPAAPHQSTGNSVRLQAQGGQTGFVKSCRPGERAGDLASISSAL